MLGSGDEANNSQLKKQQDKYLDILSDSLIDLLTAQFKFLEAFNMKQNIEIKKSPRGFEKRQGWTNTYRAIRDSN